MTADLLADIFGPSDGPWAGNEPCAPPVGATPDQIRVHADQWHPIKPQVPTADKERRMAAEAERLCGDCKIRTACLTWALDNPEATGIYGGMTDADRKRLRGEAAA